MNSGFTGQDFYQTNTSQNQLYNQQAGSSQYDFKNVQQVPGTSYGQKNLIKPLGTAMKNTQNAGESRPLTSIKGAKYGASKGQGNNFDPLNQGNVVAADLDKNPEKTPEQKLKVLEKEINKLVEETAEAKLRGNLAEALEKAKEASIKEKNLRRQKETLNLAESINLELTYAVSFNLATQYQNNGLYQEAIAKYNEIIKSKQFPQAGRLRVNMGNIYFQQKKYSIAIKMYRMALDTIPASSKEMRLKILKNIGFAFVKLGQFHDAITSFESVIKGGPDFQTAFNLILCLYALGDVNKMKDCFAQMLTIEIPGMDEDDQLELQQLDNEQEGGLNTADKLKEDIKEKKREAFKYIIDAAKLIAPVIEGDDIITGYDWIIDCLKTSNFLEVESEIEICKAMAYLKNKNIEKAITTLKSFEKKDKQLMARASSNISFLYFLENDVKNAEKYADMAITHDRYNAKALVNRGNCLFMRNEFLRAKEQYLEAIGVEADCVEALYNLAFVNKKLNMFVEALQALEKLQTIVSSIPEVIYQIANIHELMGNSKQALKWYQILLTKVPSDPSVLARLGALCAREEDENQALHYFTESYRYLPTNLETISWLGIYYVKHDLYERACHFFERASQIQPKEVKWKLMVASCYRRMGSYDRALKLYEEINQEDPTNIECLRFLVQLCKEMNLPYEQHQATLNRLQRYTPEEEAPYNNYANDDNAQEDEENINVKAKVQQPTRKAKQNKRQDDDDWANQEDVNDLLS